MRKPLTLAAAALALALPLYGPAQETGGDIPRMPDGRPDLRGIWQTMGSAVWNLEDHTAELGIPAGQSVIKGGQIPYLPSALVQREQNYANRLSEDPEANCYMVGVPRITYMPYPFQVMQTPEQITFLYEYTHTFRNARIDSEHPLGPIQWWMGDSRGHWEGDTFVVDVVHFTDQTWLDRSGNYHSSELHVVEFDPGSIHSADLPQVLASEQETAESKKYRRENQEHDHRDQH